MIRQVTKERSHSGHSQPWAGLSSLRIGLIMLLVSCLTPLMSQGQTIRDAFKAMPDTLTPYLTVNNRLDMIDFMDAKMKAVVTNLLDGETEMLFLNNDSLAVKMSDALLLEMQMASHTTDTLLYVRQTFLTTDGRKEKVLTVYAYPSWQVVSSVVEESSLGRRDEELKIKQVIL